MRAGFALCFYPRRACAARVAVREQANMQICTGLPRPGPLSLCTLEAQEVTTEGVYRLSYAIYRRVGVSTCKISGGKNMAPGTALALHPIAKFSYQRTTGYEAAYYFKA